MEIGEAIAVSVIADSKDEPCWFCEETGEPDRTNDEAADPETSDGEAEDAVPENHEKNDASKLGTNLGDQPTWSVSCPTGEGKVDVQSAAHHCIPGNASLKKANKLHRFMRKGGPLSLQSDIGYGVNHKNNGVWLPGNYGVRSGKDHYTKGWGSFDEGFKNNYAIRAMRKAGVQFHDAHPTYSEKVLETLQDIATKIGQPKEKCPICDKKYDKRRPPYGLVGRLDSVSQQHRAMIKNLGKKNGRKFVQAGYYTSSRVKQFFRMV
ncbi:MAG TPA: AHH domain-containing protein [Steroidobacteraceae bacterium]|jgi:hypothetical protein